MCLSIYLFSLAHFLKNSLLFPKSIPVTIFIFIFITNITTRSFSEPGYYEENNFGIRIENLMIVVPLPEMGEFAGRG